MKLVLGFEVSVACIQNTVPLTLHKVSTIRSMLAWVRNRLVWGEESPIPTILLVYSATVPKPKPAASVPKETILLTRDAGTVRCLADEVSLKIYNVVSINFQVVS